MDFHGRTNSLDVRSFGRGESRKAKLTCYQQHGGTVLPTEKGADVRVGDHLKSAYAGMTSYKWIEECCSRGHLVDHEPYRIGAPRRGTAGVAHRSARRNEFTPEDDRLLIEFLKRHAAHGAICGNKIYESFAQEVCFILVRLITASATHDAILEESMG